MQTTGYVSAASVWFLENFFFKQGIVSPESAKFVFTTGLAGIGAYIEGRMGSI